MIPVAVPADAEEIAVDYLKAVLPSYGHECTVRIGVPKGWTPAAGPCLQVSLDGTPEIRSRVLHLATIRLTAWCAQPDDAKNLAKAAQAVLCAHPGSRDVAGVTPLTGLLPTKDNDSDAELASVTCRMRLTVTPL